MIVQHESSVALCTQRRRANDSFSVFGGSRERCFPFSQDRRLLYEYEVGTRGGNVQPA